MTVARVRGFALRVLMGVAGGAALTVATLPGTATEAVAQTRTARIAVGPFEGERSAITRGTVGSAFADHVGEVELVSASEFNAAAERLNVVGRTDPDAVVSVARGLRLDYLIVGALERRGRGLRLQLRVLRGRDGQTAGSAAWEFDRIEELSAFSAEMWDQLHGYFQVEGETPRRPGGVGASGGPTTPPTTPTPDPARPPGPTRPPATREAPAPRAGSVQDGDGLGFLALRVGGGIAGRSWRVPILGERTPRGYENNLFGELQAGATLRYPFGRAQHALGFDLQLAVPVALSSQGRAQDGRLVTISTSAVQVIAGPQYTRRTAGNATLHFGIGLVYQSFSLDTSQLAPELQLASTTYIGLRVAGEGQVPVIDARGLGLDVLFGGELRVVGISSEMKSAFGQNPATTFGLGALFGLGLRLDRATPGLGMRATAEWVRYRTSFAGPSSLGTGSDSVDDFTRVTLSLTYAFGAEPVGTAPDARPEPAPDTPAAAGRSGAAEGPRRSADPFGGR